MPKSVTIKQLLEAGVHFGHQTHRWNPKVQQYIFGERGGIHIINLEITRAHIQTALNFVSKLTAEGKDVLFVGTKRQAQEPIKLCASACEMPYVEQRWLGGMLTNFETVRKSVARLDKIDKDEQEGNFQFVTKKEVLSLKKEREKLLKNLSGVRHMTKLPGAIFVVDSKKEEIAIKEAHKLGIPVIAVIDTNCDPDLVDYPIPGNDDAIRAVKLFCEIIRDAVTEGRAEFKKVAAEQAALEAKEAAESAEASEEAPATEGTEAKAEEASEKKNAEPKAKKKAKKSQKKEKNDTVNAS